MRQVASLILLFGVALSAGAAEIWRWKDANGVVHYSDNPVPGAERVVVNSPKPSGNGPESSGPPAAVRSEPQSQPRAAAYTRCAVVAPDHDQVFQGVQSVNVELAVEPGLQPGHRVQVFFDGAAHADWPAQSTSYTFGEVFRGSHTLNVRIVDAGGRVLCNGPSITFHLRQPGLLSPGRAAPAPAGG